MIEERAQARVVGGAERRVFVRERIRHARQRLAEIGRQHLLVGDVVRHLAQAVHVVGEGEQPGLDLVLGQHAKGMAHHGGARDLAEGADMRQARRTVAGLEQHLVLRTLFQPRDNRFRLLERPGVGLFGERTQGRSGWGRGRWWTFRRLSPRAGKRRVGNITVIASEAKQSISTTKEVWIASSLALLAMTAEFAVRS